MSSTWSIFLLREAMWSKRDPYFGVGLWTKAYINGGKTAQLPYYNFTKCLISKSTALFLFDKFLVWSRLNDPERCLIHAIDNPAQTSHDRLRTIQLFSFTSYKSICCYCINVPYISHLFSLTPIGCGRSLPIIGLVQLTLIKDYIALTIK